jgi:hypothetical protein
MPPSLQLQKWKKNQIFEAIQRVGLDPREFEFEDGDAEVPISERSRFVSLFLCSSSMSS